MKDTPPSQPAHPPNRDDTRNDTADDEASRAAATLLPPRSGRQRPIVPASLLVGVNVLANAVLSTIHTKGPTTSEPSINHQMTTGPHDWVLLKCSPVEEGRHRCDILSAPSSWVPLDPCSGESTTTCASFSDAAQSQTCQNEDGSFLITIQRSEVEKVCSHGDPNSEITAVDLYLIHGTTDVPQDATSATVPTTLNGHTDRT